MSDDNEKAVPRGTHPSEEERFYISWGRETLKRNLAFANEVLRQLVTINCALLGGSIAFLDEKVIVPSFKPWIIGAFWVSLVISFLGMMPYEAFVDLRAPEEIKQHKEAALNSKRCYLWAAGVCLGIGFGIALAGTIARLVA